MRFLRVAVLFVLGIVARVVRAVLGPVVRFAVELNRAAVNKTLAMRAAQVGAGAVQRSRIADGAFVLRKVGGRVVACVKSGAWWASNFVRRVEYALERRVADHPVVGLMLDAWQTATSRTALQACALALFVLATGGSALLAMGSIRYMDNIAQMATLNITPAADAGFERAIDLDNGKATRYVQCRVSANVTVAGVPATSIRNLGLADSLFEEVGIKESGNKVISADGRAMMFASEWMCALTATLKSRVTSVAVGGPTTISSTFRIWMENPQAVAPKETLFLEKLVNTKLQFYGRYSTATTGAAASTVGAGRLFNAPAGCTVTIDTVSISVEQYADATLTVDSLPLFRPRVDQFVFNPVAVNNRTPVPVPVDTNEYLRGITLIFDNVTSGLDGGLVNGLALRGDKSEYLGQGGLVSIADYIRAQAFGSGGEISTLYGGTAVYINFQKAGRLSNLYNPLQDTNLKLILDVIAVPAGAQVLVVKHSLIRDLWQGDDGRRVCAKELPADLAAA